MAVQSHRPVGAGACLFCPRVRKDRERLDIASSISVPLLSEGTLLGVLNVSSGKKGHQHDDADLERLKSLSHRLSRLLFESLKLQELQMRHREERFRNEVETWKKGHTREENRVLEEEIRKKVESLEPEKKNSREELLKIAPNVRNRR